MGENYSDLLNSSTTTQNNEDMFKSEVELWKVKFCNNYNTNFNEFGIINIFQFRDKEVYHNCNFFILNLGRSTCDSNIGREKFLYFKKTEHVVKKQDGTRTTCSFGSHRCSSIYSNFIRWSCRPFRSKRKMIIRYCTLKLSLQIMFFQFQHDKYC